MPDDAASLPPVAAGQKLLNRFFNCPELLIAPDNFYQFTFIVDGKHGKRTDEIEQIIFVQHTGN